MGAHLFTKEGDQVVLLDQNRVNSDAVSFGFNNKLRGKIRNSQDMGSCDSILEGVESDNCSRRPIEILCTK